MEGGKGDGERKGGWREERGNEGEGRGDEWRSDLFWCSLIRNYKVLPNISLI